MATISKEQFKKCITNAKCVEIMHYPGITNCSTNILYVFTHSLYGCLKFFVIIYLVEGVIKYKYINAKYIKEQLKKFSATYLYGLLMTNIFYGSTCVLRNVIGKYYYETSLFVPATLGGLSIFIENDKMRYLNTVLFFTLALETTINYLKGEKIIVIPKKLNTVFLMICNAIFLYLLKHKNFTKESPIIWFFDPRTSNEKSEKNMKCCGKQICYRHLLQTGFKYFTVGYTFQTVKSLIGKIGLVIKNPINLFSILLNRNGIQTGVFFSSYVLIYKVLCKLLHEYEGTETRTHSLIAGFFAGLSFSINTNMQLNFLPITLILQILWFNIQKKYNLPKWYYKEIVFALCFGILLHSRFFFPTYTPNYVLKMISMASNGRSNIIFNVFKNNLDSRLKQLDIKQ